MISPSKLCEFCLIFLEFLATKILSSEEELNNEGKGRKYLEKEYICSSEETKKKDGKGRNNTEKENIWSAEEKKNGYDGKEGSFHGEGVY